MFKPLFTINLNQRIIAGKVSYGKFDGQHCCMIAAISEDKLLVHHPYYSSSPNQQQQDNVEIKSLSSDVNILNINQKINSICCGRFKSEHENDLLVVGTQTSLLVYDVYNNKDLFFKEIPDGSNAVAIGEIGNLEKTIAISGSNCAISGFDFDGNDSYWTVTGDNLTCMCVCDLNQDGLNELITGSDGNEICVFKDEAILFDLQETDVIKCVCYLDANYFAYALRNGTVGVYHNKERIWRIKSKKEVICIVGLDVNNDGVNELITGWSSGKVDVRDIKNGQVIHKEIFKDSIAGLFVCDYNMDRKDELIVVTVTGEMSGFQVANNKNKFVSSKEDQNQARKLEQDKIRELLLLRHSLQLELRNYENNNRISEVQQYSEDHQDFNKFRTLTEQDGYGAIPANTQLKSSLTLCTGLEDDREPCIELGLETTNDCIIRAVIIFAEGIFNEESFIAHPNENEVANNLTVQLKAERNISIDLHVKAIVGYNRSNHYHVFELVRNLPKFAMFAIFKTETNQIEQPTGKAVYNFNEKANKMIMWLNKNFLVEENCYTYENNQLTVNLKCLRSNTYCIIELNEMKSQLIIQCNSMQVAGELMQSIVNDIYTVQLNSLNLNCTSNFPSEIEQLRKLVNQINKLESVRQQLNAEFQDNTSMIKELIIKAEDARLLNEFKLMKQYYGELNSMNKDLINGFRIRNQNQQELVGCLKEINVIITHAANLRIGTYKAQVVQASRQAIKQNNLNLISRIIVTGED